MGGGSEGKNSVIGGVIKSRGESFFEVESFSFFIEIDGDGVL